MVLRAALATLAITFALAAIGSAGCKRLAPQPKWHSRIATACAEAASSGKPLFVFYRADWDVLTKELETGALEDVEVRSVLSWSYVALRVDRTNTYMNPSPPADEEREDQLAIRMFAPYASKYGTILVMGPDCKTERYRGGMVSGSELAADLRAAMDGPVPTRR